ncbi:MAG: PD-(D/E)XK nuclease family protein [Lysobacterales bacterium]
MSYDALFRRLRQGHVLVTANNRLARVLGSQYTHWRMAAGDRQWQSPALSSWAAWLDTLWEKAAIAGVTGTDRAVPGKRQLLCLWERVLKTTPMTHDLLRPESLAGQLRDTRRLVIDWQLDLAHPAWHGNENYRAFRSWNQAFEQWCLEHRWVSPEDRTPVLVAAAADGGMTLPENIDLMGFDEFDPAQAALLTSWIEHGSQVTHLDIASRQKQAVLLACRDPRDELRKMAHWLRQCKEDDPDSTIAIVVPDLQARRRALELQLAEVLTPGTPSGQAKPWNISIGTPLTGRPMIEAVFDLLNLLQRTVDIQDLGRVLRSPWIKAADTERNSRALLEKCLREEYPRQFKLSEAEYRSREVRQRDRHGRELPPEEHCTRAWNSPVFNAVLKTLIRFRNDHRKKQPASAWAEAFDRLLARVGWPAAGAGDNTAIEHDENWQALQAWREVLQELASLDAATPPFNLATAIYQLRQICRDRTFQARTPPASIQLLGLYEVNGLRFDHLWVLGMGADNWPPAARPNPFIPGLLQTAANIPRSNPQRELGVAVHITRRLLQTAPDCVFSYPARLDGEDLMPSPLLDIPAVDTVTAVPAWPGVSWRQLVADAEEPRKVPLKMPGRLVQSTARGGSSILENQALCPFRAFAVNRLGAEGLEKPADGISPMLHGSLVHQVLERFWRETVSQKNLLQLDANTLEERVQEHVESVTNEHRGIKQRPAFRRVEAERIQRHVLDYLTLEKRRCPFEAVGFEKEVLTRIEGQEIRLFIDRVDRLADGDEIIIDYKTSTKQPKKWFGERPEDPQLPLYAISAERPPAAVVFGILREDGCKYEGVVTQPGLLPGLPPNETNATRYLVEAGRQMPETIDNWREVLHGLMSDFLAGHAAIDPKNGPGTCTNTYCELQSLCRIAELEGLQRKHREAGA